MILLWIFIFIHLIAYPQLTVSDLKNSETYIIHPNALKWDNKSLPFKNVVVIDNRFDTSKLGYIKDSRKYEKLNLTNGLPGTMQQVIHSTLQNNMDASSNSSLYIFINHLWIQPTTEMEFSKQKLYETDINNDTSFVQCNATLESFIHKDDFFYPLLRIDSSFLVKGKVSEKSNEIISLPFQFLLNELNKLDLKRQRKPVESNVLLKHYEERLAFPRMKTDILEKGVYLNYQDFLNNRISNPSFTIKYKNRGRVRYIFDEKEQELLHNIWGYCNGEKLYVKVGPNYYELTRENYSYELIGSKDLIRYNSVSGVGPQSSNPAFMLSKDLFSEMTLQNNLNPKNIRPLQLNMETGEPY